MIEAEFGAKDSVRSFVRVTVAELSQWLAVDVAGRAAQAVTQRARAALPDDDEEQLEYAAMWWAVGGQVPDGSAGPLIVAALDIPADEVRPVEGDDPDRGFEIELSRPLPRRYLVALHVSDEPPA
ncbi:MAG: hypothetical protein Q4P32_13105, partial [Micrococcales bacterium]|nr:hypothetical protein [Micrococcales bacterium]